MGANCWPSLRGWRALDTVRCSKENLGPKQRAPRHPGRFTGDGAARPESRRQRLRVSRLLRPRAALRGHRTRPRALQDCTTRWPPTGYGEWPAATLATLAQIAIRPGMLRRVTKPVAPERPRIAETRPIVGHLTESIRADPPASVFTQSGPLPQPRLIVRPEE
jgi:hypothetical protein